MVNEIFAEGTVKSYSTAYGLDKIFQQIDEIEDMDVLKKIDEELSDNAIMKKFWENRKVYLTTQDPIKKKQALIKCKIIQKQYGASVPLKKSVHQFTTVHGLAGIHISAQAKIGTGCTIFQQVTIGSNTFVDSKSHGFPTIGDNVFIGAGATIIGNVSIGNNVRIGANCIVTKDVPDNSVCVLSGTKTIIKNEPLDNKFINIIKYMEIVNKR